MTTTRLRELTENSRLSEAIKQIEEGTPVNWVQVASLQCLDIATCGRAELLDALDREDQADEDLKEIISP